MSTRFQKLKDVLLDVWENTPVLRAAGYVAAAVGGLVVLNNELPPEIAIDLESPAIKERGLWVIVVAYFVLVSVFSGDRLRFERKLRALEQNFKYDNRGTLYNGSEPNIAFRVTTFKAMLARMSQTIDNVDASLLLNDIGREASADFA